MPSVLRAHASWALSPEPPSPECPASQGTVVMFTQGLCLHSSPPIPRTLTSDLSFMYLALSPSPRCWSRARGSLRLKRFPRLLEPLHYLRTRGSRDLTGLTSGPSATSHIFIFHTYWTWSLQVPLSFSLAGVCAAAENNREQEANTERQRSSVWQTGQAACRRSCLTFWVETRN